MRALTPRVDALESDVDGLKVWRHETEPLLAKFADGIAELQGEVRHIDAKIERLATKADVHAAANEVLNALGSVTSFRGPHWFSIVVFSAGFLLTVLWVVTRG